MPDPLPKALERTPRPEVKASEALSLFARPGNAGVMTRRVAILVADGVDGGFARAMHEGLAAQGAMPRFVGVQLGEVESTSGEPVVVEVTLETAPSVLFDAMVVPDGASAVKVLTQTGQALEFIKDQYRHCKAILLMGAAAQLLEEAGIPDALPNGEPDRGLLRFDRGDTDKALRAFAQAVAEHRNFARETDPPVV